jgi:hypothetical protein
MGIVPPPQPLSTSGAQKAMATAQKAYIEIFI